MLQPRVASLPTKRWNRVGLKMKTVSLRSLNPRFNCKTPQIFKYRICPTPFHSSPPEKHFQAAYLPISQEHFVAALCEIKKRRKKGDFSAVLEFRFSTPPTPPPPPHEAPLRSLVVCARARGARKITHASDVPGITIVLSLSLSFFLSLSFSTSLFETSPLPPFASSGLQNGQVSAPPPEQRKWSQTGEAARWKPRTQSYIISYEAA